MGAEVEKARSIMQATSKKGGGREREDWKKGEICKCFLTKISRKTKGDVEGNYPFPKEVSRGIGGGGKVQVCKNQFQTEKDKNHGDLNGETAWRGKKRGGKVTKAGLRNQYDWGGERRRISLTHRINWGKKRLEAEKILPKRAGKLKYRGKKTHYDLCQGKELKPKKRKRDHKRWKVIGARTQSSQTGAGRSSVLHKGAPQGRMQFID